MRRAVATMLACLFGAFCLCFSFPALAQSQAAKRYGLIEIGGSGVKGRIVRLEWSAEGPVLTVERALQIYNFNVAAPESAPAIAQAVARRALDLRREYGVEPLSIYLVADAGVAALPHAPALKQAVDEAVAGSAGALAYVSSRDQARLGFNGLLTCARLAHRRAQVLYVDVGSAETTLASATGGSTCSKEEVFGLSLGLGVKSAAIAHQGLGDEERLGELRGQVEARLQQAPKASLERPRVYLGGGIAWALATMLHPQRTERFVPISADDIDRLRRQLASDPACVTSPERALVAEPQCGFVDLNFLEIGPANERYRVVNEHREIVTSIFTLEQLKTGLDLLQSLADALQLQERVVFFARPALDAWVLGFLLEREAAGEQVANARIIE